ncbi:hypothetical protein RB195_013916 [Necator americanus]|uniref:Uncharacterized protein n=1 Tax=Necator americanus TaxID=51031 RepID=A0ABR1DXR0_NECAM
MHRLLRCRKHASGIALSSVSGITPSTAEIVWMRLCTIAGSQKTQTLDRECSRTYGEDHNKDAFHDELNTLISRIPSQQAVIVEIDTNAKMGFEQQSDVLEKWFYHMEQTSDNGNRLIDLCKWTTFIIASTFKRNHRRHQLTWQGTTH